MQDKKDDASFCTTLRTFYKNLGDVYASLFALLIVNTFIIYNILFLH